MKQRRRHRGRAQEREHEPANEQALEQAQAQEPEQEAPPQDQAGDEDRQGEPVALDEGAQDSALVAAAGAVTALAALGAMAGTGGTRTAMSQSLPLRAPMTLATPKPKVADESTPSSARLVPVHERASDADPGSVRKPEQAHLPLPVAEHEDPTGHGIETTLPVVETEAPDPWWPESEQVDMDEADSDDGDERHGSDEFDERDERDDRDERLLPTGGADLLRLSLKNDTGRTEAQKNDLVTRDATVLIEGMDQFRGPVEFRIDAGPWTPLVEGEVISDAHFPEEGAHHVEVRSGDQGNHPLPAVSLKFEVDRSPPGPRVPVVVRELATVNESGAPDRLGGYLLTDRPLVKVLGIEAGDRWTAAEYDPTTSTLIGKGFEGDGDQLPAALFKEGPQIVGVTGWDRAGNGNGTVLQQEVWLDMTPPPAPRWSSVGEIQGVEQFRLDNLERHAHLEHRPDEQSGWQRVQGHMLAGPQEIRQVDLAGNVSLDSTRLMDGQVLKLGAAEPGHTGGLRLNLKNDTGRTDEQRSDLITRDATVQIEGIAPQHGTMHFRINGGRWQPLGDGRVIDDAQFQGDGSKRVDVQAVDRDGIPLSSGSLTFEVDRTPVTLSLKVGNVVSTVNEAGAPDRNGKYALTRQAQVTLLGLEEGAGWIAHQYDDARKSLPGREFQGVTDRLPDALFKQGAQIVGVSSWDRAGNAEHVIRLAEIWLDATPPPAPELSAVGEALGIEQFQLRKAEPHAHFNFRPGKDSDWKRLELGMPLAGPQEIQQVDLAGNASLQSVWLTANQVLVPTPVL
ncbi:hypothetical protein ABE85_04205 [Mitsuaria sp. 7]|nr:hypothetical protein ABE85_04205 [Mitsuaria sp. 7]